MNRALLVVVACLLMVPATAVADGLPATGIDGSQGVVSHDGAYRYLTFAARGGTVLARVHVDGGSIERHRAIRGAFSVPAVAYDGTGSGLSADGRTLVLIAPRTQFTSAQKHTRLAVLDARRLRVQRSVVLNGDFSLDAISPDGSKLYVVQYLALSRRNYDPTKYKVRVLDVSTGKLDPAPIVDPRQPDEKMGGLPVTRAMSADGRWAYTLYSGSQHPFVHALDTIGRTARCIDLDSLAGREDLYQLRLRVAGARVEVVNGSKPLALVSTTTFKVSDPPRATPAPHADAPPSGNGTPLWPFALAAALLVLIAGAAAAARPRRSRALG